MKTRSKALVLTLCALLLVASTVFGTLAYLTDTDKVTNTFTVGKVGITLDEAKVNTDGTVVEGADRVQANTYHLIPGHTYVKDPTIHIDDDSEEAYLFVKLEIADNADLEALLGKYGLSAELWDLLTGSDENAWTALDVTDAAGTVTYLLSYNTKINGTTADVKLFDSITVPAQFTKEDLAALESFKITVTAYAVQADGFNTAAAAWEATFGA